MIIYTAIFGKYDDLKEPTFITPGWRYVCYTDQDIKSNAWKIIHKPCLPEGPQRTARYYKIMFHNHIESNRSIWVDASFQINCDLNEWVRKKMLGQFTTITHPFRNCVYEEINTCIAEGRGEPDKLRKQYQDYEVKGLPRNNGLVSSGILMRDKTHSTMALCEYWWSELQRRSVRDQLAFAYSVWKEPTTHTQIKWDYRTEMEFIFTNHFHKRNGLRFNDSQFKK